MTTRSTQPATASDSAQLKDWKYSAPLDETKIALGAIAGAAVMAVGLSQIFNPVALGIAGAYGIGKVLHAQVVANVKPLLERELAKDIATGKLTPVEDDEPVVRIAADISRQLGHKEPPKAYYLDASLVAKIALPVGLRWLMKFRPVQASVMPKVFAAVPGANLLYTTREALNNGMNEQQLRYITAHEMSHLHKDRLSPAILTRAAITHTSRALMLGCAAGLGLALFGAALPLTAAAGGSILLAAGGLWAVSTVAKVAANFGMRTLEARADRNALHITRDLQNATSALDVLHGRPYYRAKRTPLVLETLSTHPTQRRRIEKLQDAFNDVAKYKPATPVNDNAAVQADKPADKRKIEL